MAYLSYGGQNDFPLPKDIYVLILKIYEYIMIPGKGKLSLQMKLFANQMTLK